MNIRRRTPSDVPACVDVLSEVQKADGYPLRWPLEPPSWLDPPSMAAAWVAEVATVIVGHVMVVTPVQVPGFSAPTGRSADQLMSVSRLFVGPTARGRGVAGQLLLAATEFAHKADTRLVLDVVDDAAAAIRLYEALGWELVGRQSATWTTEDGERPMLRLYVAP